MKSYTGGRNLFGVWTKNTATANLSYGDQIANDDYRHLCALMDWPFLERNRTVSTVASTQAVTLPYDCDLVREISVVPNGSTMRYTPRRVADRETWDLLNLRSYVSDIPENYFVTGGQVLLWPIPAQTGNTVYIDQKSRVIDLSVADYTDGTITSIASGGTAVIGSGTTWTSQMVGRWINFTYSNTANTGDGLWYEISAVQTTTTMTLVRAYGGTSISAGTAAYTIGQMPLLPEAFQDLPWQWAAGSYWAKEADIRANAFFDQHGAPPMGGRPATGRVRDLIVGYANATTDMVLTDGVYEEIINPNLTVSL